MLAATEVVKMIVAKSACFMSTIVPATVAVAAAVWLDNAMTALVVMFGFIFTPYAKLICVISERPERQRTSVPAGSTRSDEWLNYQPICRATIGPATDAVPRS